MTGIFTPGNLVLGELRHWRLLFFLVSEQDYDQVTLHILYDFDLNQKSEGVIMVDDLSIHVTKTVHSEEWL